MATRSDYAHLNEGLDLFHRGLAWEAHEAWETVWHRTDGPERSTLQALIQIAAAHHKHRDDVVAGIIKNLRKALTNLDHAVADRSACLGFDLVDLRDQTTRALESVESPARGTQRFRPVILPRRTGPDGFVYLHGFASSPKSFKANTIVPALEARGWAVAVPDLNEGDFSRLTVTRALAAARRRMRDRTIIIGSSLGGYLATLLSNDAPVLATVLMAPAYDFVERLRQRHGEEALADWASTGSMEVEHYGEGRPLPIRYSLVSDAQRYPPRPSIYGPSYILQGSNDDVVPADMVADVAAAYDPDQVRLELFDDDHALRATAGRAREAALAFAERFDFTADPTLTPPR